MITLIFLPPTILALQIPIMVTDGKITTPKFTPIMVMIPSLVVLVAMKSMDSVVMISSRATLAMIN